MNKMNDTRYGIQGSLTTDNSNPGGGGLSRECVLRIPSVIVKGD